MLQPSFFPPELKSATVLRPGFASDNWEDVVESLQERAPPHQSCIVPRSVCLKTDLNIDGVQCKKYSALAPHLWPVLGRLAAIVKFLADNQFPGERFTVHKAPVFMIGFYNGIAKAPARELLKELVDELISLSPMKPVDERPAVCVQLERVIADSPAAADLKEVTCHGGYMSQPRCMSRGVKLLLKNRVAAENQGNDLTTRSGTATKRRIQVPTTKTMKRTNAVTSIKKQALTFLQRKKRSTDVSQRRKPPVRALSERNVDLPSDESEDLDPVDLRRRKQPVRSCFRRQIETDSSDSAADESDNSTSEYLLPSLPKRVKKRARPASEIEIARETSAMVYPDLDCEDKLRHDNEWDGYMMKDSLVSNKFVDCISEQLIYHALCVC